jgi:MFS family permease
MSFSGKYRMSEFKPKRKRFERLTALQYRDFRLLWTGEMVSTIGSQMQLFAINWHVYQLLRGQTFVWSVFGKDLTLSSDAFGLGMIGLVRVIPIVLFALVGGVLADAFDRRTLMIWTRIAAAIIAAILTVLTLQGNISVNMIYLLTALGAAATAFDSPARQSIVPNLVNPEHLPNAVSLNTLMFQVGSIAGPALAGVLVAQLNIGVVYGINVATFIVAIIAVIMIKHRGKLQAAQGIGWNALVEGIQFTYNKRIIWGTMLLDFFATLFSSARTMLPIVASDILHVGAGGYGFLATAQPIGSLIVGTIIALRSDIKRQGIVLLVSVGIYGLSTAIFGMSTNFALSYAMFALIGASDTVSTVIRGTIRQLLTPDHLRGRMVSVNMMFFMGGPQLGELEAGVVAALWGTPFAIVSGGIATILLTVWVAWKFPAIRNYTNEKDYLATERQTA